MASGLYSSSRSQYSCSHLSSSYSHRAASPHIQHKISAIPGAKRARATTRGICKACYYGQSMQVESKWKPKCRVLSVSEFLTEEKAVWRTGTLNTIFFQPLASLVTFSSLCITLGKTTLYTTLSDLLINATSHDFLDSTEKPQFMTFSQKSR